MQNPNYTPLPGRLSSNLNATIHSASGTAYGVENLDPQQLANLLEQPDCFLWRHIDCPVKMGHDCVIVRATLRLDREDVPVAYKRYRPRNWWKAICGRFRPGRALEAWRKAATLLDLGIATARPIAAIAPAWSRGRGASYLATQWIEGSRNLHLWGWELAPLPLAIRLGRAARCADSLGRLLGRMHAGGIGHRDLKAANILVTDAGGRFEVCLVDLDGLRTTGGLSDGRRARDLARLAVGLQAHPWVTRAICCRFLRAYAAESPPGTVDWKRLWRVTAAYSRANIARKRRRKQPLL